MTHLRSEGRTDTYDSNGALRVSVIVPTLNPGDGLTELGRRLLAQSIAPCELVAIDSASDFPPDAKYWRVLGIERHEFDHGRTRNLAAHAATGDILIFMTQDALPIDDRLIERLTAPLRAGTAAASFARQVARPDAPASERVTRAINYPAWSDARSLSTGKRVTSKTLFFSNVCSAIDRQAFDEVGGFPEGLLISEDMVISARLLRSGKTVMYAADAVVEHSHTYDLRSVFRRNFDIGAFFVLERSELGDVSLSGDGFRFVKMQAKMLIHGRSYGSLLRATFENVARLAGFAVGRHVTHLPHSVARRLSFNPNYWMSVRGEMMSTDRSPKS